MPSAATESTAGAVEGAAGVTVMSVLQSAAGAGTVTEVVTLVIRVEVEVVVEVDVYKTLVGASTADVVVGAGIATLVDAATPDGGTVVVP